MKLSFQEGRDPQQNSDMFEATRRVMVQEAINQELIRDDDLAMIPEVMPLLFKSLSENSNCPHPATEVATPLPQAGEGF